MVSWYQANGGKLLCPFKQISKDSQTGHEADMQKLHSGIACYEVLVKHMTLSHGAYLFFAGLLIFLDLD